MDEPVWTAREVAARLRVSPSLVYDLVGGDRPRLRSFRLGRGRGCIRIPESAVLEYLEGVTTRPAIQSPRPATMPAAVPDEVWMMPPEPLTARDGRRPHEFVLGLEVGVIVQHRRRSVAREHLDGRAARPRRLAPRSRMCGGTSRP